MAFALSSKTSMVRGSAGPESMGIMARRGGRARREGSEESKNELARRQPDFFFLSLSQRPAVAARPRVASRSRVVAAAADKAAVSIWR